MKKHNYTTQNKTDILVILKKRQIYSDNYYKTVNSGLYNSAMFVNNMLVKNKVKSNLIEVIDNNEIDKYVTQFKPKYVIVEAIWVVPSKFEILQKLHPNVKWIIRLHSELPFLANEGNAINWLKEYTKYKNVFIASNSKIFNSSMNGILNEEIYYLPNYYPTSSIVYSNTNNNHFNKEINIGLFGAIRPMKNCLTQAVAAILYANKNNKILNLHINTQRIEQKGENTLKNIQDLFKNTPHKLIEYPWLKHSEFIEVVKKMDLGLQVSLSETYNIVTADFVNNLIPVVVSKDITFINKFSVVENNNDALSIAEKIKNTLRFKKLLSFFNKVKLIDNSKLSEKQWLLFFKNKN